MIKVNKRDMEWEEGMTVQILLDKCKYTFPLIVVRINGESVSKEDYSTAKINDNDVVDVIHLISGG